MKTASDLRKAEAADLQHLCHKDLFDLRNFFVDYLNELATHLKLRQRVVATASVYFRRFYCRNAMSVRDAAGPAKVAPACLYLAAKVEECNVHAHQVCSAAKKACDMDRHRHRREWGLEVNEMLDLELLLLQELQFYLVVFHPYRDLVRYVEELSLDYQILEDAWLMANDTYRTDLCLLFPPYLIALGVLYTVGHAHGKGQVVGPYLAETHVDEKEIRQICMEMLNFYNQYPQRQSLSSKQAVQLLSCLGAAIEPTAGK